jgi:hypothetical protein
MRLEYEAAEARGLIREDDRPRRAPAEPSARERAPANKPVGKGRMKVVWLVCDLGGRTVATFDYPQKADAEALIAQLKSRGRGNHFLRSDKVPMD